MIIQGNKIRLCSAILLAMFAFPADTQSTVPVQAQHPPDSHQPAPMGGVKTGTPRSPVLDSEHRPITAGGFVKTGQVIFEDISEGSGLAKWCHTMGNAGEKVHFGNRWLGRGPDRL